MSNDPQKQRYPLAFAVGIAEFLRDELATGCSCIEIVGSIRRKKETVGDIELLYIPKQEMREGADLFEKENVCLATEIILRMERDGILARRKNSLGRTMFGPQNKYMVHCSTGIPVDLFATNVAYRHNYLVCRTGPAASNSRIASEANRKGWTWNPYGGGFSRQTATSIETHLVHSEEDVFRFVGLPFLPPELRH